MREFKDYLLLFAKGVCMGAADIIPGVSGGTIAFITNIYEELVNSLKLINAYNLKLLIKFQLVSFWKAIHGNFLASVFSGVLLGIVSLAKLIAYFHLFEVHAIQIWSFFFGLVIVSAAMVLKQVQEWKLPVAIGLLVGIVTSYFITIVSPAITPDAWWFIFISGALAICAMILPGISGAFILLILGKYTYITRALDVFNYEVILVFVAGVVTGLMSFVRIMSWVLKKYYQVTIAVLSGFMIGSLNKIWPWKEIVIYRTNAEGNKIVEIDQSVFPNYYCEVTGNDPQILQAILMAVMGIGVVLVLEKIASRNSVKR